MRTASELAELGLQALIDAGAEKAECQASNSGKNELSAEVGEMSLLRTTHDLSLNLIALVGDRKGTARLGSPDEEAIAKAAVEAVQIAAAGAPDDANDISELQPSASSSDGTDRPDLDLMFERLRSFLEVAAQRHPKVALTSVGVDHDHNRSSYRNSNGVRFDAERGLYSFGAMFSAKDGSKVGSMNGTGLSGFGLDKELMECGTVATLLRQAEEHLDTEPVIGKFVGDIIITPDCLGDFVGMLAETLGDGPLIAGTSMHREKLDAAVASPLFTLHSRPVSGEVAAGYGWTADGYAARDLTVVDSGVLRSFLLGLYGSRKTKKALPAKSGGCWVVDAGNTNYSDMVAGVKRGLLLSRFSGGHPGDNGDFSGVAKNSYLIEGGVVKHPVSETMISGNLSSLLKAIVAVSRERVDFGGSIFPWVQASGVTISGK